MNPLEKLFSPILIILAKISGQLSTIISNQEKIMATLSQADQDLVAAVTALTSAITSGLAAISAALTAASNSTTDTQTAADIETQVANINAAAKQMNDFVATLPAPVKPTPAP